MQPGETIYGLFDSTGRCRYVGRTSQPDVRSAVHGKHFSDLKFVALCQCNSLDGREVEREVIQQFHRLGQADLNTKFKLTSLPLLIPPQKLNQLRPKLAHRGLTVERWIEEAIDKELAQRNGWAQTLGRLGKGVPKTLTRAERIRRRERMLAYHRGRTKAATNTK